MSHPTSETLLALSDGALTVAARRDVQEHVDACLDCRGRLNELAARIEPDLRQTAQAGGRETFYESFTRRVDGPMRGGEWALEGDAARPKGTSAAHRLVLGGVVVAAVLVGLTMVVQPRLSIQDLASRMLKSNAGLPGRPNHAAKATAPPAVTTPPQAATAPPVVYASPARLNGLVEHARALSVVAEQRSRAENHDAAAVAWEQVRDTARPSNPVWPEATDHAADERYSAWAHTRNSARELAARRALAAAMAATPKGPERDHLNELLKMVRTFPRHP